MNHLQKIADRVKELLKYKQMNQHDLAVKMKADEGMVSRWLNGKANLTIKTISRMEEVLGEQIIIVR